MARSVAIAWSPLVVAFLGCGAPEHATGVYGAQPIELAELDRIFVPSSQLLAQMGADARERERASLATGALLVPWINADANRALAGNGATLRASCGVTFASPSYAVTAAHCVDATRMDTNQLTVRMFRPTLLLGERYRNTTTLSGTFPDYTHERLSNDDGYLTEDYDCTLVARCADDYGGWTRCERLRTSGNPADGALIRCAGAPGAKYGTAPIATTDDTLAEVFMPWKHEIYAVPLDPTDDRFQHYSRHYEDPSQNYHYFDRARDGSEYNQLLPLISTSFADGTPHHKREVADLGVTTDLFGCHGASGSGVWQRTGRGEFELLGPVARGNHELEAYLCNHSPSYDGFSRDPGSFGLTYGSLEATRTLLDEYATLVEADCDAMTDEVARAFAPSPCGLRPRPENRPNLLVDAAHPLVLHSTAGQERTQLRVGLLASCIGSCGTLRVTIASKTVVTAPLSATTDEPQVFGAGLELSGVPSPTIEVSIDGSGTARIEGLGIAEEGRSIEFESAAERVDVQLVDTRLDNAAPTPIRVEGRSSDFAARLEPGERLVFTRQALLPDGATHLRFDSEAPAQLSCGLLSSSGVVLSRADCATGLVRLEAPKGAHAAAFYIESGIDSPSVSIDRVRVASALASDSDGDGIPDTMDDCPRGALPPSGELLFSELGPDSILACVPGLQPIRLRTPRATNPCKPVTLRGFVTSIRGQPVSRGTLPISDDPLELPNGAVIASYDVLDEQGRVATKVEKTSYVSFYPTEDCCSAGQRTLLGSSTGEVLDYSGLGPICALTGNGADLVLSTQGPNYIAAGGDADYVSSQGEGDVVLGGEGDDYLRVSAAEVFVHAGPGDDTIHATGANAAELHGGSGRDIIIGSAGSDTIVPGSGGDWVDAGAGDDTVILYAACEVTSSLALHGGEGTDVLRSPSSEEDLRAAGVTIDGFESIVIDDSLAYLADCSTEGAAP